MVISERLQAIIIINSYRNDVASIKEDKKENC